MEWFDYFIIFFILSVLIILIISLFLFVVAYIKSILFVNFLKDIEKKGYRLKFVEYLIDDTYLK